MPPDPFEPDPSNEGLIFNSGHPAEYGVSMCDLSVDERDAVLGHVEGITDLAGQVAASAQSIRSRSWMDHEELDRLLQAVEAQAAQARAWVGRKVAGHHA